MCKKMCLRFSKLMYTSSLTCRHEVVVLPLEFKYWPHVSTLFFAGFVHIRLFFSRFGWTPSYYPLLILKEQRERNNNKNKKKVNKNDPKRRVNQKIMKNFFKLLNFISNQNNILKFKDFLSFVKGTCFEVEKLPTSL